MKIITVCFNNDNNKLYTRLMDVFKFSAKKYMPDVEIIEIKKDVPVNNSGRPDRYFLNHLKLQCWVDEFEKLNEETIFCDCDLLFTNTIEDAFNFDFDIAYTESTNKKRVPFNLGILFAKPTENAKLFLHKLLEIDGIMLNNRKFHAMWSKTYLGINQAAFGYMLDHYAEDIQELKIHKLITRTWNAINCDWSKVNLDSDTKVIHYKGPLRRALIENSKSNSEWNYVLNMWRNARGEMLRKRSIKN
jgi:hypothetical protein